MAHKLDGSLQTKTEAQLVTASGYTIEPAITIPQNATSLTIGRDGIVSVTQAGSQATVQVGQLQIANFLNPTGLQSMGENLYTETDSSGAPNVVNPGVDGAGILTQGYTEASNVNVVEELVNMNAPQRAYEINSKASQTAAPALRPPAHA